MILGQQRSKKNKLKAHSDVWLGLLARPFLFVFLLLTSISLLFAFTTVTAQPAKESDLRAAIIFRLLQFSQWQYNDQSQLSLCIYANGKGTQSFTPLNNQLLHSNISIHVRELNNLDIKNCDVVVIGENKEVELDKNNRNIFVVCNNCKKNIKHAAINLFRSDDKLKYNINRTLANRNDIHFRAAVLKSAKHVIGDK